MSFLGVDIMAEQRANLSSIPSAEILTIRRREKAARVEQKTSQHQSCKKVVNFAMK